MASKSKHVRLAPQPNLKNTFIRWTIAILAIKAIIIMNISGGYLNETWGRNIIIRGIWLGSDGENYIAGYFNLVKDGLFSADSSLSYFPAGYPLVILLLSLFGKSWLFITISIFQSILFSYAAYFFALQLSKTKLKKFSFLVFILIVLISAGLLLFCNPNTCCVVSISFICDAMIFEFLLSEIFTILF